MNALKKYMGIVWMIIAPVAIYLMLAEAFKANSKAVEKMNAAVDDAAYSVACYAKINTNLQWGTICFVFIPIMIGFFIFGYLAFKNEYEHLPESSAEVED